MTPSRPDARRALPAWRARPPGPPGVGAAGWAARAAALALLLAIAWTLYTLTAPLPATAVPAADPPVSLPRVAAPHPPIAQRRALIETLSASNLFSATREPWPITSPGADLPTTAVAQAPIPATPASPSTQSYAAGERTLAVTRADALPDEIKTALTGLALRSVYIDLTNRPVALISRVHAGPNPFLADPFVVGDEFTDKQHPQATWKVEAIDQPGARVVLSRSGVLAWLALYAPANPAPTAPAAAVQTKPPAIIARSENEIRADLITGGIDPAEADRLIALAKMSPQDAAAQARLDALATAAAQTAGDSKSTRRRGPPPGMESVLKMMREAAAPQQPTIPDPAPTPAPTPQSAPTSPTPSPG